VLEQPRNVPALEEEFKDISESATTEAASNISFSCRSNNLLASSQRWLSIAIMLVGPARLNLPIPWNHLPDEEVPVYQRLDARNRNLVYK